MRSFLVLLLVLSLGCIGVGGQKQECLVAYNPAGVAVTSMQLDYPKIYAGNSLRLSLEVANLGEETGRNIGLSIMGPDHYFDIPADAVISKDSMEPPDPNKCIEGGIKSATVQLKSKTGVQALEGVPIRLKLAYGYKTRAWADIVVLSEQQWAVRVQEGYVPQLYQGQTVAPIKINMAVPAVPIVSNSTFYVQVSLENTAGPSSESKPMSGTTPDTVDKVTITIPPDKFEFVESGACNSLVANVCTIEDFEVTKDPKNMIEKKVAVKLKDSQVGSLLEENFKIMVDADYGYNVFYDTKPVIIAGGG